MENPRFFSRHRGVWIFFAVCAVFGILYLAVPPLHKGINEIWDALASGNIDRVVSLIRSCGKWAILVSFFLMVFQSVAAPLPAFLITFANAAIFGWWQGAILSWFSAMAGAGVCFGLSRALGREAVEKLAGKTALSGIERFFSRYGANTILICRLLPFVSFDAVSYFAGLTSMRLVPFLIATGLGQLPATVVYSYVGGMLTGGTKYLVMGLFCTFALSALAVLLKKLYQSRHGNSASSAGGQP